MRCSPQLKAFPGIPNPTKTVSFHDEFPLEVYLCHTGHCNGQVYKETQPACEHMNTTWAGNSPNTGAFSNPAQALSLLPSISISYKIILNSQQESFKPAAKIYSDGEGAFSKKWERIYI